jgi:hypothetical protein
MTLYRGTKLGPYEIVAPLGAGGVTERRVVRDMADVRLPIAD